MINRFVLAERHRKSDHPTARPARELTSRWQVQHGGDGAAQRATVTERVGAVDELIHRTGQRQIPDTRVSNGLAQCGSEPVAAQHKVGAVIERPDASA